MIVKQIIEFGCGCALTKRALTGGRKFTKFDHPEGSNLEASDREEGLTGRPIQCLQPANLLAPSTTWTEELTSACILSSTGATPAI